MDEENLNVSLQAMSSVAIWHGIMNAESIAELFVCEDPHEESLSSSVTFESQHSVAAEGFDALQKTRLRAQSLAQSQSLNSRTMWLRRLCLCLRSLRHNKSRLSTHQEQTIC